MDMEARSLSKRLADVTIDQCGLVLAQVSHLPHSSPTPFPCRQVLASESRGGEGMVTQINTDSAGAVHSSEDWPTAQPTTSAGGRSAIDPNPPKNPASHLHLLHLLLLLLLLLLLPLPS